MREDTKRKLQEGFLDAISGTIGRPNTHETREQIVAALMDFTADIRSKASHAMATQYLLSVNSNEDIKKGVFRYEVDMPVDCLRRCSCRPMEAFREGDALVFCDHCFGVYAERDTSE